jgi:nucleoid DNA-binding protein
MIDYILEILEKNNRVIVPELGAFIVKQRTPLLIIFNEFLQYNDGMLADTIAKKENIDCNEAKIKLDQFTSDIKDVLDRGEYFVMGKLGDLVKTPSGKISLCEPNSVFEKSILFQDNEIAIEIEEASLTITEEKTETEEPTLPKPVEKVEIEEVITDVKAEPIRSEPQKPAEIINREPETAKQEVEKIAERQDKVVEELKIKKPIVSEVEIPKPYVTTSDARINHQPSSTKTRNVVIWTVVIVLVNAAIAGIFLRSQLNNLFKKNVEVVEPVAAIDSLAKLDSVITSTIDSTLKQELASITETPSVEKPLQQANIDGFRYYIVAGVFRSEANADKMVADLQKKGFKPEKFGKLGDLYGVSYQTFTSKENAEKALIQIKSETDPGAWLKTINY